MLIAPQIIGFPLKLNDGQVSLLLRIIEYATFALIMLLKMRHPIEDKFPPLFENVVLGSHNSCFSIEALFHRGYYTPPL